MADEDRKDVLKRLFGVKPGVPQATNDRMEKAGEEAPAVTEIKETRKAREAAAPGDMSQSDFSGYGGMSTAEKQAKAKKLAETLRNR